MKKRKSFFALVLMSLALLLGVGYAAVSSVDFSIGGSVDAADYTLDVSYVGDAKITKSDSNLTASATVTTNPTSVTVNVGNFKNVNDNVVFEFTMKNNEASLSAKFALKEIVKTSLTEYYYVATSLTTAGVTVAAQGTTKFTVTVTMKKVPVTAVSGSFTINYIATPVEPN